MKGSIVGHSKDRANEKNSVDSNRFAVAVGKFIRQPFRLLRTAKNAATPVSTRLTREGVQIVFMCLFVMIGAVLRDVNLLIILAGTLFATLLIQWRVCGKTLYGLTTTRRLPRSMHARRPFEIELSISNPKKWLGAWLVLAQDRLLHVASNTSIRMTSQGIGMLYPSVPPLCNRVQKYNAVVQRRGRYKFLGTELTTRFPFGLMRGILPLKGGDSFVVQPAIGRLLPAWSELYDAHDSSARQRRKRSVTDEGEFFGLRPYRPGDSPRSIHWRTSARRNELVVKQFEKQNSREIVLVLDLYHSSSRSKEERDRETTIKNEDIAIEFIATLAQHVVTNNNGLLTVAIADSEPMLANRIQSRSHCNGLLDRLGVARSAGQDEIAKALRLLERDHHRIENLVVISTRPRIDLSEVVEAEKSIVFWRSMTWLNASAGELVKYFVPAD